MKRCIRCGEVKALADFGKHKARRDGLRSMCRPCNSAATLEWQKNNPEKACKKAYRWVKNNPEKRSAIVCLQQKNNPERRRAKEARWRSNNPGASNAKTAGRKAARLKATPGWVEQAEIRDWYRLASILSRGGIKFHIDHVVPLRSKIVCGLHAPANFQVLPAHANISKSNRYWPNMP